MKKLLLSLGLLLAALAPPAGAQTAPQAIVGYLGTCATGQSPCFIQYGATVPVSGSITASNPSVSTTGAAVPASATYMGISIGGNLTGPLGGAGTEAGALRVTLPTDGTGKVGLNAGTAIIGKVGIDQTTDITTNGVEIAPTAAAAAAITPVVGGSGVSSQVLKAGAGNLYDVYAECSSACWLMVFNATSAPSNGATTAGTASGNMVECVPISAGGIGGISYGSLPARYSVGITATISSTTCATLTLSTVGFIHGRVM